MRLNVTLMKERDVWSEPYHVSVHYWIVYLLWIGTIGKLRAGEYIRSLRSPVLRAPYKFQFYLFTYLQMKIFCYVQLFLTLAVYTFLVYVICNLHVYFDQVYGFGSDAAPSCSITSCGSNATSYWPVARNGLPSWVTQSTNDCTSVRHWTSKKSASSWWAVLWYDESKTASYYNTHLEHSWTSQHE